MTVIIAMYKVKIILGFIAKVQINVLKQKYRNKFSDYHHSCVAQAVHYSKSWNNNKTLNS